MDHRRHRAFGRIGTGLLLALAAFAPAAGSEVELDGWRLQQYITAADAVLGEPFKTLDQQHLQYRAHRLGDDAYLVFGVDERYPGYIQSLQLTGTSSTARPFRTLVLGDSAEAVLRALGEPTARTAIAEPMLTRWDYEGRNYSVELDERERLYSIRIHTDSALLDNSDDEPWEDFKAAVVNRDLGRLAHRLRPDVEIFIGGQTLSIQRRFSDFIATPDPEFAAALFADAGSVRDALLRETPEGYVRVTERMGVGLVFKFSDSSVLREIVFFPYDGRHGVYEIAFREAVPEPMLAPKVLLGTR